MKNCLKASLLVLCWQCGAAVASHTNSAFGNVTVETNAEVKSILIPSKGDVKFLNFRQISGGSWEWISLNPENLKVSKLNSEIPYKIAIHGFLSNCSFSPLTVLKAYAKQKVNANLICVDWSALANPVVDLSAANLLHFPKAVGNTRFVGESVAGFIIRLLQTGYLSGTRNIHLIGHSLGSHVAGVAGHSVYAKRKMKIGRITGAFGERLTVHLGLDPAVPIFFPKDFASKLNKDDASFVDVIYTHMAKFGVKSNVAHAIFLPNGGSYQPFCKSGNLVQDISETVTGECSHTAAPDIFAKSILEKINACKCKSWTQFVFKTTKSVCPVSKASLFGDKTTAKSSGKFCLRIARL